jgi:protoheme ferro-lyase
MAKEKIKLILTAHGVPHYEQGGAIYADSMESGTALFERVERVSDWSAKRLFDWLGY